MTEQDSNTAAKPQIYALLTNVMQDLCGHGGIGKDRENQQQRYRFRGIDDVLNHCGPLFAKHGITVIPKMRVHSDASERVSLDKGRERVDRYCLLELHLTLSAPDGSSVTYETLGSGLDFGGDKHVNKAMSAAFKYALFLGLAIPVDAESIADGDFDPKEPERPKQPAQNTKKGAAEPPAGKTTSEPNWITQVQTLLKACGCQTADDASAVLAWGTGGAIDTPEKYKADQETAKQVYEQLKAMTKEIGTANALDHARTALAASNEGI